MSSETTPLFPVQRPSADEEEPISILPVVERLASSNLSHLQLEDLLPDPSLTPSKEKQFAFGLVVLLHLWNHKIRTRPYSLDIYEQWIDENTRAKDATVLEDKLEQLWDDYLAQYHSSKEFYDVLLSRFTLGASSNNIIRVVDYLSDGRAPSNFVAHPVVTTTMTRLWRFGRFRDQSRNRHLNSGPSPYELHFLELLFDFLLLILLLSYVIRPPDWPESDDRWKQPNVKYAYGVRELYVLIHTSSVVLSRRGATVITSALILLTFLWSFPSPPVPGETPFTVLLWATILRLFMYNVPTVLPNPLLLVPHHHFLPLSTFLLRGLIRIIHPLFLLYLPMFLFVWVALSISLSGPLTGPLNHATSMKSALALLGPGSPIIGAAPMETRVVLLFFSIIIVILALSSVFIIGTSTSAAQAGPMVYSPLFLWDFYNREVGHEARITSYHATRNYLRKNHFIIPFNLVELLFVSLPSLVISRFPPRSRQDGLGTFVWKITVRPCLLISLLICWPLLLKFS